MVVKFIIEACPAGEPGLTLYVSRCFRAAHEGTLSAKFEAATRWDNLGYAERRAEAERRRLPNRVHGHITFTVVPIQVEEQ